MDNSNTPVAVGRIDVLRTFVICTPRLLCTPEHFIHINAPMVKDLLITKGNHKLQYFVEKMHILQESFRFTSGRDEKGV